mmetsp:Transcript_9563/g.23008  ORF Transcript_9563/g.23008 Transcript_9563/m.23008 type:complete len:246 (-) Transcript_9563:999-1736(-)
MGSRAKRSLRRAVLCGPRRLPLSSPISPQRANRASKSQAGVPDVSGCKSTNRYRAVRWPRGPLQDARAVQAARSQVELHYQRRHVVAANPAALLRVPCQAVVHELAGYVREGAFGLANALLHKVNRVLVAHHVPDPIAGQDQELVAGTDCLGQHIRLRSDDLVFPGQLSVALVLEVPNGAAQVQVPVDPADAADLREKAPGSLYARLLRVLRRFVVSGEGYRFPVPAKNSAAVPSIGNKYLSLVH